MEQQNNKEHLAYFMDKCRCDYSKIDGDDVCQKCYEKWMVERGNGHCMGC